jgi:tetratricopeptide (TPR) repeat protein
MEPQSFFDSAPLHKRARLLSSWTSGFARFLLLIALTHFYPACAPAPVELMRQAHKAYADSSYALAILLYTKALAADSTLTEAFLCRGEAYQNLGMIIESIRDYDSGLRISGPRCDVLLMRALARRSLVEVITEQRDEMAPIEGRATYLSVQEVLMLEDLNKLLDICPGDVEARCLRGAMRLDRGELEDAINDFTVALILRPKDPWIYNQRGRARYLKGDVRTAIEDYSEAISLDDSAGWVYYNRGLAFFDAGDLERAVSDFNVAIAYDSEDAWAYFRRGQALLQLGERENACKDFRAAVDLGLTEANEIVEGKCR